MRHHEVGAFVSTSFALLVVLGAAHQAVAQDAKTPYPKMAPIDRYLTTDRGAEIVLARSAAPESISRDATILVPGRKGYETAVEGKNGFVCMVKGLPPMLVFLVGLSNWSDGTPAGQHRD